MLPSARCLILAVPLRCLKKRSRRPTDHLPQKEGHTKAVNIGLNLMKIKREKSPKSQNVTYRKRINYESTKLITINLLKILFLVV